MLLILDEIKELRDVKDNTPLQEDEGEDTEQDLQLFQCTMARLTTKKKLWKL